MCGPWLGTSEGIPATGAALAELYALRDDQPVPVERAPALTGRYL